MIAERLIENMKYIFKEKYNNVKDEDKQVVEELAFRIAVLLKYEISNFNIDQFMSDIIK